MKIVIPDDYTQVFSGSPVEEKLRRLGDLVIYDTPVRDEEEAIGRLRGAQIAVCNRDRTPLGRRVLESLPDLRLLSMTGEVHNNLDLKAATELGIVATYTESSSAPAVAELTFGLLISLLRGVARGDAAVRRGEWPAIVGIELQGKTMGILGLGKIGGAVARLAQAFHMKPVAWGPTLTPERAEAAGVTYLPLEDLLRTADVVSVHLRLVPKTRGVLGAREISLMKPSAVLINTARAAITEEAALVAALRERRIAGAGLDVFGEEPLPPDSPLLGMDNVVLTPHLGWTTDRVLASYAGIAGDNVESYLAGKPTNLRNPEVWEKRRRG